MVKHYVGEAGTALVLDTGVNIGTATEQYIKFKKPDGTSTGSFASSLYSSYSDLAQTTGTYLLSYSFAASDLNIPGEWRFQAYVGAVAGTWLGETVKIKIYDAYQ